MRVDKKLFVEGEPSTKDYIYTKQFIRKDGSIGESKNIIRYIPKKKDTYINDLFCQAKITKTKMKELNVLLNDLIHFKGYYKYNMVKKINKLKVLGRLTPEMELLFYRAILVESFLSDNLEEYLIQIMEYYELQKEDVERFKQELESYVRQ